MKYFKNDVFTNSGDPIHIILSPVVNDDGTIDLVESGKENTDDMIQSFAESCDINIILKRVANGETELLQQRKGMFGDFTNMPKTYAEVLQLQIDSNNLFNSLPIEIKQKFDNDANKFFVSAGSKEWIDKLGDIIPKQAVEKYETKEVNVVES